MAGLADRRRLVALGAAVLMLVALIVASGAGTAGADTRLQRAAHILLNSSGFPGIPQAGDDVTVSFNGAKAGQCFDTVTDPDTGEITCHYGRSASVYVGCQDNARRAQAFVHRLIKHAGFKAVAIKVDAAAVHADSRTGEVALAFGNVTVEFIMDAFSDDDQHPVWDQVKHESLKGAANVADTLRHLKHIC